VNEYVISRPAIRDLESISLYFADVQVEAGEKFLQGFSKRCKQHFSEYHPDHQGLYGKFQYNKQLGAKIMDVPEPLFKYTTLDTAILILRTGRLRWSSPRLFNDIVEFQRMPRFEPSLDESLSEFQRILVEIASGQRQVDEARLSCTTQIRLGMVRMLIGSGMDLTSVIRELTEESRGADDRMHAELRATFESFDMNVNTARVFCLTTEPDNDAMWAHYAGSHTGIVLGFRHLQSFDTPFLAAQQVGYSREAPVVASGLDFLLYGATQELGIKTFVAICCTKSSKWEYENEWRAITWRPEEAGKDYGDYEFYPEELESVCFGAKFDDKRLEEVHNLVLSRYPRCSFHRMIVEAGQLRRVPAS
jgi:hypothetical protein